MIILPLLVALIDITEIEPPDRCFAVDSYKFTGDEWTPLNTIQHVYTENEAMGLSEHLMSQGERGGEIVAAFVIWREC